MSRFHHYVRSLATGYGLLAVNIAYSLAMVPLALHHLGKEVFGLWALTMQIGAIVQLADAGMTGALNRILMEYKDDKYSPEYRQVFYTMWLVFSLLGVGIALGLVGISPWLVHWLAIPAGMQSGYATFLGAYGLLLGFMFAAKPFPMLPFVHQRSDLLNTISAACLVLGFAILWFGLRAGWGLWSLLASLATGQMITTLTVVWICFSLGYFPRPTRHPRLSRTAFREVFDYGKDRMLVTIGFTTLQAAPTFLITRILGLEANAAWSVTSRMNQMCLQLIAKIPDLSYPALAEMHVRGEQAAMQKRYSHLMAVGLGITALCAVGIATCNRDFVNLWTGGKIQSSPLLDVMLGIWLLTLILQKFLFVPASIARDIKEVRFFYLFETLAVFVLGLLLLRLSDGIWLMAAILSAASLVVTIPRNLAKSSSVLQCDWQQLVRPVAQLGLRVLLPASGCMVAASIFMPMAGQWWSLVAKSFTVAAGMLVLLASLPELRQVITETFKRLIPVLSRRKTA